MTEVLSAPAERFDFPLVRRHPKLLPAGLRLECGPGWGLLLDELFQSVQAHVEASQADQPAVLRVKEKFGSLRVSMGSSDPAIADLVGKACARSAITCEICGGTGIGVFAGGWQRTRCAEHRDTPAPWL